MQKPLALSIAVCLSLSGCQVFEKSKTWDTVMSVRPGDSFRQADPSSSYADKLHRVLLDQGVEHFVVTYQYHYYTHQYEEALGTRTAVVYRDDADSRYPWWLKDDRTATPVWLPNAEMDKQLSFYCHRPAEIIEKKHYPAGGGSGKEGKAVSHPRTALVESRVHVAQRPLPVTKIALAKPAPTHFAKPVVTYHAPVSQKSVTTITTASPKAVTKIQHSPTAAAAPKAKPVAEIASGPAATNHSNPSWTPPTVIDPVEQASDPAPRDERLEKLFRTRNGTSYDRTSAVDRRKMEQLKHGLVGKETTGERAFRHSIDSGLERGVDGLPAF
ncbi:MAG: hypothetical protein ABJF10_03550 [Chthoniobacter sp.]|uniref:hypothetical protein n=1 Tax=Chthoniobacter sp. TaxID=2510640 RepID=UPI0032A9CDF2